MSQNKVKITQKEIDDIYEIETLEKPTEQKESEEEEFLTKEEEEFDIAMHENLHQEDKLE